MRTLDVRLSCCVLDKKRLLGELKQLSSGKKLELIAENTKSMKELVQKFVEMENCKIINVVDDNGATRMMVQKHN